MCEISDLLFNNKCNKLLTLYIKLVNIFNVINIQLN